jgi:hypothetical protein
LSRRLQCLDLNHFTALSTNKSINYTVWVVCPKTTTSDGLEVFSIIDFIKLVCKGKSDNYGSRLWPHLETLSEMEGLIVEVPLRMKSPKSPYKQPPPVLRPDPATTREGLQKLLLVLGDKVKDEFRQVDDTTTTLLLPRPRRS